MSEIEIIMNDKEYEYNYDIVLTNISQPFSKENKEKNKDSEKKNEKKDMFKDLKGKKKKAILKKDFIKELLFKKRRDDISLYLEKVKNEIN